MSKILELEGRKYSFIRRVAKMGSIYLITLPRPLGESLYKKRVQVTIELLKEIEGDN